MKKALVRGWLICLTLVTSCNLNSDYHKTEESISSSEIDSSRASCTTSVLEASITPTCYSSNYDIDSDYLHVSFGDAYSLCEELTGGDFNDLVQSEPDRVVYRVETDEYDIVYIPDYSAYLDMMTEPDNQGYVYIFPTETEYHIKRSVSINGFLFSEFEDDYWAEVNYSTHMDLAFEHDSFMDESDYLKGYAFLYDESDVYSTIYYACYITDCCFIKYCYWFNSPDVENYQVYLEVCEELGLPTCSEMTEAITT